MTCRTLATKPTSYRRSWGAKVVRLRSTSHTCLLGVGLGAGVGVGLELGVAVGSAVRGRD